MLPLNPNLILPQPKSAVLSIKLLLKIGSSVPSNNAQVPAATSSALLIVVSPLGTNLLVRPLVVLSVLSARPPFIPPVRAVRSTVPTSVPGKTPTLIAALIEASLHSQGLPTAPMDLVGGEFPLPVRPLGTPVPLAVVLALVTSQLLSPPSLSSSRNAPLLRMNLWSTNYLPYLPWLPAQSIVQSLVPLMS